MTLGLKVAFACLVLFMATLVLHGILWTILGFAFAIGAIIGIFAHNASRHRKPPD
jgi:hypothetical protein